MALGDKQCSAGALNGLGDVALSERDSETACARYQASLTLRWELGQKRGVVDSLEGLAQVAAARGECERAARLLGTAAALRAAIGAPPGPDHRARYDALVARLRERMGEDLFAAASAVGQATMLAQTVTEALGHGTEAC
jgi:hypothetical protein